MQLLQALFFPPEQPGGVSSMVPYIHEKLNRMGWSTELFSLPKRIRRKGKGEVVFDTFDWKAYAGNAIVDKYIQTYLDYKWWSGMRLNKTFDLIHAHHPIAALVLKKQFPSTPLILTIHSSFERELLLNGKIEEDGPEHRFLTSMYHELETKVDQVVTVSHDFKNYLGAYMQHPERIVVIPNGFDPKRFRPIDHRNEVPQLVTLCRLVPAKGIDVLLQACADLKRRGLKFMLHVIGDGPARQELEELAKSLDIYEEIIFYGYMLHPEEFMPFFDIFALPSRAESFGNVFAEAALCWLALVGTEVGGIPEQIEHEQNGLLVPVDDVKALSEQLERLITNESLRTQLASKAYEKAKKNYSLTKAAQKLRTLYEKTVNQKGTVS